MDMKELRQKTEGELKSLLAESGEKLRLLRFERAANRLKNSRQISGIRKDVARALTVLRKK